ncbi:hypothetical protein [Proteocatella sphenisci]|uniref:hypothetical protein n=1 Tax=Proteocatella sphenisci TaxID=181070 RepID=UPI00048C9E20|nr:hypothetical protein [Proteocatella sphenisci]
MYRLLGNDVLDTEELSKAIESLTLLRVREDISNATKRDDAAALRLELGISILGYDDSLEYEDEEVMNELMAKSDEYVKAQLKDVVSKFGEYLAYDAYSYTFDEVSKSTLIVMAVMSTQNSYRKMRDVIKRLLTV